MMAVAPNTPKLVARFGADKVGTAGLSLVGARAARDGSVPGRHDATCSCWSTFCVLLGGMALTMTPMTTQLMAAVPRDRAGMGSATNDTTRELGGALGVAVLGSLLASQYTSGVAIVGRRSAGRGARDRRVQHRRRPRPRRAGRRLPAALARRGPDVVRRRARPGRHRRRRAWRSSPRSPSSATCRRTGNAEVTGEPRPPPPRRCAERRSERRRNSSWTAIRQPGLTVGVVRFVHADAPGVQALREPHVRQRRHRPQVRPRPRARRPVALPGRLPEVRTPARRRGVDAGLAGVLADPGRAGQRRRRHGRRAARRGRGSPQRGRCPDQGRGRGRARRRSRRGWQRLFRRS